MANTMTLDERLELIVRNIPSEDVHGIEAIKSALKDPTKTPKCLWGEWPLS